MKKHHINIPVFVPHIGCPHDCVFCNQRHITGINNQVTPEQVRKIIEEHLQFVDRENSCVEVAFFGGSFTGIDFDLQTLLMETAYEYVKSGRVDSLRCSTRPDCIDEKILENLKKYGMKTIELGVQSTDREVLLRSGRGHSREAVFSASELIKSYGFSLGLQMMLGLPCDTKEKSLATADDIISLSPDCVRIYPTIVLEDTRLYHMYKEGTYTPITLEYAVELSAELIEKFTLQNIEVIRIGLQTTHNINEKTVIGPYHSAMGELAWSRFYRNRMEKKIIDGKICESLSYYVPKGHVSKAVGQHRENINYLKEKYGVTVKVSEGI